jgi:hypothetical protein
MKSSGRIAMLSPILKNLLPAKEETPSSTHAKTPELVRQEEIKCPPFSELLNNHSVQRTPNLDDVHYIAE